MPPAFTGWPPYTFTPLRFDSESLPFFVEPAPFLWAASITKAERGAHTIALRLLTVWPANTLDLMLVASILRCAIVVEQSALLTHCNAPLAVFAQTAQGTADKCRSLVLAPGLSPDYVEPLGLAQQEAATEEFGHVEASVRISCYSYGSATTKSYPLGSVVYYVRYIEASQQLQYVLCYVVTAIL